MEALWVIAIVAGLYLIHQLRKWLRGEIEDTLFHAAWNRDMADWRARREAFKSLREQERALWNVGKSDEALDVREKADCLYPNFAAAENDMQKEMDALLRGAPLPVSPPSMSLIK